MHFLTKKPFTKKSNARGWETEEAFGADSMHRCMHKSIHMNNHKYVALNTNLGIHILAHTSLEKKSFPMNRRKCPVG